MKAGHRPAPGHVKVTMNLRRELWDDLKAHAQNAGVVPVALLEALALYYLESPPAQAAFNDAALKVIADRARHAALHKRTHGRSMSDPIPRDVKVAAKVAECTYCGGPADTVDHVIPRSKGGTSDPENLVPACRECNSSKGNRDVMAWLLGRP